MSRRRFDDMPCSIARALDLVGDWWTLLIIREAFLGVRRFADYRDHLGIARNILADRLRKLVAEDILAKQPKSPPDHGHEYRLTEKGIALAPVVLELLIWAARYEETSAPCELIEQMARNREGVLAEVKRRWAEDDPAPLLPKFRTKERKEDL